MAGSSRVSLLLLLLLACSLSLGGCAASGETASGASDDDGAEAIAAIMAQSKRLSDAYVQGDIEALLDVYAPDGVAIPGNRDFVKGRDALRALWTLPAGRTVLRHEAVPLELRVDGAHAYDWGYFEGQAAQDGKTMDPFRGAYVIVWARGDDGTWRIAADMWNSLRD